MQFSSLSTIFSQGYYAIPDYQRDYEWSAPQNLALIEDIFSVAFDSDNTQHFIGAIVTIPYEENTGTNKTIDLNDYGISTSNVNHIVDGQQRLTSLSILIQALWDCISEDDSLSDEEKKRQGENKLRNLLKGTDYNSDDNIAPKLILNGNTGRYYNSEILRINSESGSSMYRGAKRVKAAYELFKKSILESKETLIEGKKCIDEREYYKSITDVIMKKIIVVEIICDASYNAFQVFDSLNGKGLDLTAADRIKNILLSWAPGRNGAEKWETLVTAVGESHLTNYFVSLFFSSKGKRISKNKLPDMFKETYKDSAMSDFDYFYSDIMKKGALYGQLRKADTKRKENDRLIKDLIQLKFDQVFVLMFAVAAHYEDIIKSKEYEDFLKALINLVVRIQVCEKSTNRLDSIFSKCIDVMNNIGTPIKVIIEKLNAEMRILVDDDEFIAGFEKLATSDNKIAEYYLRKIEEYIGAKKGRRAFNIEGVSVEHIIPRTLDVLSDWYGSTPIPEEVYADFRDNVVERIGNKVLLFSDDNSAASNKNYESKKIIYRTGKQGQDKGTPEKTFYMIAELLDKWPEEFNHNEVNERSKLLASYAVKIWR